MSGDTYLNHCGGLSLDHQLHPNRGLFDVAGRDRSGRIEIREALALDDKSQVADAFAMLLAGSCLRLSFDSRKSRRDGNG